MIGKLKGILDTIEADKVILDVSGVGYIIYCSNKTLSSLPLVGESVSFLTHMQVKEDDISLYGFLNLNEQQWFENLITVQGIGPRLALVILSFLAPEQLTIIIVQRDKEAFKHVSGVGPKLAERIFTELAKKADLYVGDNPNLITKNTISEENNSNINDALTALTNLGYSKGEALAVCRKICQNNPNISISNLIRSALQELSS
ncbi:MAG: Holliday junction branch migration protein RuvA [Rickettsiales bacterium]